METGPRVIDNIVGAISRAVIADVSSAPVDEIVNAVLANLPLKDDTDEYDTIFKLFTTLLTAQHPSYPKCLPKIVECAAHFYSDVSTDKVSPSLDRKFSLFSKYLQVKTGALVSSLLKQTAGSFGGEMQSLISSLPPEQGQKLMTVMSLN